MSPHAKYHSDIMIFIRYYGNKANKLSNFVPRESAERLLRKDLSQLGIVQPKRENITFRPDGIVKFSWKDVDPTNNTLRHSITQKFYSLQADNSFLRSFSITEMYLTEIMSRPDDIWARKSNHMSIKLCEIRIAETPDTTSVPNTQPQPSTSHFAESSASLSPPHKRIKLEDLHPDASETSFFKPAYKPSQSTTEPVVQNAQKQIHQDTSTQFSITQRNMVSPSPVLKSAEPDPQVVAQAAHNLTDEKKFRLGASSVTQKYAFQSSSGQLPQSSMILSEWVPPGLTRQPRAESRADQWSQNSSANPEPERTHQTQKLPPVLTTPASIPPGLMASQTPSNLPQVSTPQFAFRKVQDQVNHMTSLQPKPSSPPTTSEHIPTSLLQSQNSENKIIPTVISRSGPKGVLPPTAPRALLQPGEVSITASESATLSSTYQLSQTVDSGTETPNTPTESIPLLTKQLTELRDSFASLITQESILLAKISLLDASQVPESVLGKRQRDLETRLQTLETNLENERRSRIVAENIVKDVQRECKAPFVVPALLDAFASLSKLTTETTLFTMPLNVPP